MFEGLIVIVNCVVFSVVCMFVIFVGLLVMSRVVGGLVMGSMFLIGVW